jgi:hypothetical protein
VRGTGADSVEDDDRCASIHLLRLCKCARCGCAIQ